MRKQNAGKKRTTSVMKVPKKQYGNYELDDQKVYKIDKEKQTKKPIADAMYIEHVKQDIKTNKVIVSLAYKYFRNWKSVEVERAAIQVRKLPELSNYGVDVKTTNAADLEHFLSVQEKQASYVYTYRDLGWLHFEDNRVFAHHQLLAAEDLGIESEYQGKLSLEASGTKEVYLTILEKHVFGHTPLEFIVALGFASIIASLISFEHTPELLFVHCYGESSKGKTTSSRLLASIFGKASVTSDGLIRTWNATEKALTTQFGVNHGIPMILDEASVKEGKHDFSSAIYKLAQGVDVARLNADTTSKEQNTWSGVIYSTAEHSLTHKASQNSGLKVRVFEMGHEAWTRSKEHAEALNQNLEKNYGWLLEPFIQFLFTKKDDEIQKQHRGYVEQLLNAIDEKEKDDFTGRICNQLAYVLLGAEYANECFQFSLDIEAIQQLVLKHEMKNVPERCRAENAFEYIQSQITQYDHSIISSYPNTTYLPNHSTIGKKTKHDTAILKEVVDGWLREKGFNDPQGVMTELKSKGYLSAEKGHNTRKRKIYDREVVVYVFPHNVASK